MDHILLHIGIHKTGTTSIQRFLSLAHDDLLENGVLFPLAGRSRPLSGQHLLAWAIHDIHGIKDDRCWYELIEEIHFEKPQQTIISAEGFETCTQTQIEKIQKYLKAKSVKIIIYIRNQLDFMVSDYKESVKTAGYYQPFQSYLNGNYNRCDYGALVERWGNVFGLENVVIRLFDKVKENPGLLEDFLLVANLDARIKENYQTIRANISPPDDVIILFYVLNKFSKIFGRKLSITLNKSIMRSQPISKRLRYLSSRFMSQEIYSKREIEWLRNKVAAWNQDFLDTFIDDRDHKYFDF
jgi:hypothetical protein